MRRLAAALILAFIFVAHLALAGGGDWSEPQQQVAIPETRVVIEDHRGGDDGFPWEAVGAVAGAGATVAAAWIGVRQTRKRSGN